MVSARTGIPRNTLITWERRHGLVRPARAENGYRTYTEADVQHLERIKAQLAAGVSIGDVAVEPEVTVGGGPYADLLHALLAFDTSKADTLRPHLTGTSIEHAMVQVYLPMLVMVGDLWADGRISVAQEHGVSAWVRDQLGLMLAQVRRPTGSDRVLLAGMPEDAHELGLMSVAVRLSLRGLAVTYLGPNVPVDDVVAAARSGGVSAVALSAVLPRDLDEIQALVNRVRVGLGSRPPIFLGGPGVAGIDPASLLGATVTQDVDLISAA